MLPPYDLHVLATPPAFRLSQDQTLQLNFSARFPPHARRGAGTDSFGNRVYPRNEFVHTRSFKTRRSGCYCLPRRLGRGGQSGEPKPRDQVAGLSITRMQGSNIIDGIRSKLIKEDHFVACTTRMFESLSGSGTNRSSSRRRDSPARQALYTKALPNQTHPRGFRLFTCQRAFLQTPVATFVTVVVFPPSQGSGILSSIPTLSIGC